MSISITTVPMSIMTERAASSSFDFAAVLAAALAAAADSQAITVNTDDGEGWVTSTANGHVRGLQERHGPAFLTAQGLTDQYVVKAGVTGQGMPDGRKAVKVALVPKP
jgi:hypothetical protein